jgi:hypothetical protein
MPEESLVGFDLLLRVREVHEERRIQVLEVLERPIAPRLAERKRTVSLDQPIDRPKSVAPKNSEANLERTARKENLINLMDDVEK